nr:MAG TPA: hypothetical protein [Caudoviricetes sp.]
MEFYIEALWAIWRKCIYKVFDLLLAGKLGIKLKTYISHFA